MIMFYSFFMFLSIKDRAYLHYVAYTISMSVFFLYTQQYLVYYIPFFSNNPSKTMYFSILLYVAFVAYYKLMRRFTNVEEKRPRLNHWLKVWIKVYYVITLIATCLMLTNLTWFFTFNDYLNALMLPVFFGFLVAIARIKSLLSRYFVLGSLLVISGGAVVVAAGLQGVPAYRVTFYFQLGVLFEVFVFALGLSVRFRLNQQKVQQAQEELIEQLRQNEELQANHAQELEETVEQRTAQLQNAYDSITDSVQYAQRIQQSMLAHPQEIAQHFGDCFILFKPKDIVSGDFYWFAQHQQSLVIAAVDCTGHGVPGAFMTIMGNDFLNEIVQSQHLTTPADILSELDQKITQNLKKQTGQADINDGMDMAVLTINYAENTLQYAGAKNPLWQVSNGQMKVVKASKFPIGSAQYLEDKVFDNHSLPLQKGDVLYLFSDGFQDQFGGSHDKKYMKKRFREFLLSMSHLPLAQQHQALTQEFEAWKQSQPQTDDVLVIGIQV
jgi:serine phosphatase RsbU (regulator of sigma subunit)